MPTLAEEKCTACGEGTLKKAKLSGVNATIQPYREQEWEPNWKGVSDVSVKVCPECGNISFTAEKPRLFREDE